MKKVTLIAAIVASLLVAGVAAGQGALSVPGSGWWSGEQVQNVGTSSATIQVTAYDAASTATFSANTTLAVGGSKTFVPSDFASMPSGFQGSAVVSSDQPIKAIVNVTNRQSGVNGVAGGLAAGQYQGMETGSTSLNFPIAKNNYFNKTTTFYIQNTGAAAATATATFIFAGTSYVYTTPSIGPNQMVMFTAVNATAPSGNTNGNGSLAVTSAQPLVGAVMEHFTTEAVGTVLQATRGFSSNDYDTKFFVPLVKNTYFNRFTGLQVMNVSASSVNITVTYQATTNVATGCAGGTFVDTATNVAPNASNTFVQLGTASHLPVGCLGSATVEATGNVVGVVNESYTSAYVAAGHKQEATTYSAMASKNATTKISFPLYKEDSFNKGAGLQIQNVGAVAATNVVLVFSGPTGSYTTVPQTIPAGGALNLVDVRNKAASFWSGTAMTPTALGCTATGCTANGVFGVTITSDQPIVGMANESTYPFTAPRIAQDKSNYEGFNLTP